MAVFCNVTPCRLVDINRRYRGAFFIHHQGDFNHIVLMMEAVIASETSVNIYHSSRCIIPEDSSENLKFQKATFF
jgi:hypothetical protein